MGKKDSKVKVVAVGDGAVGKTCLLMVYVNNEFPEEYIPTVFENYDTNVKHKGNNITLSVWDTAGQEDYDELRHLSFTFCNCFLVCFAVTNKTSFNNISTKWIPEIKNFSAKTPFILVGTKGDMRGKNSDADVVSYAEAEKLAKDIGAVCYIESSARTRKGVDEVFQKAIDINVKKGCEIM
ncbi:rho family small GTPase [Naegleria gruberi]|uniref:Rho family small GTPase n=1 Tax=Naegleria gruberi TaxID=5762 RepID=D2VIL7_NAEGR|nr:rho family small GTPase [Naegleria gruberi]EFC43292.1 rho family small GTPase [Naegleria gruberi]|eukprot:XP_002676036.1 rho family small GTPase [Naegleria gruberi strain NEG-M]